MRRILLFVVIIFITVPGKAQVIPIITSAFSDSLGKIILSFRNDFQKIQGNLLPDRGDDMKVYNSKTKLPGSENCIVQRFFSGLDTTSSWQGIMYSGNNHKEASKIYKNTAKKVKSSKIKWIDNTLVGFNGDVEEPNENLSFAVSTLRPQIEDVRYDKFIVEVELVNLTYDEWEVRVNILKKKNDETQF